MPSSPELLPVQPLRRRSLRAIIDPARPQEPVLTILGMNGNRWFVIDMWGEALVLRPWISRREVIALFAGAGDFLERKWPGPGHAGRLPFNTRLVVKEIARLAAEVGHVELGEMERLGFQIGRRSRARMS